MISPSGDVTPSNERLSIHYVKMENGEWPAKVTDSPHEGRRGFMERRIRPDQVRLGMYVRGFGGSWLDHPFWRVKFVLRKPQDVERVRQSGVPHVLIDDQLGLGVEDEPEQPPASPRPAPAGPPRPARAPIRIARAGGPGEYSEVRRTSERKRTIELVTRSKKVMRHVFDGARLGRAVRIADVISVVDEVAEAVERGPRTLLDVIRLKKRDEYTYLHSVAVCTLMVNMARFLGKGKAEMREFGLAGLLHDIGKMGVPEPVLQKPGQLTDAEFQAVRGHPEYGHRLLCETEDVGALALDVCLHHHEKMDGTGYPVGLKGEEISFIARLGAICDVYDALTSDRPYKKAWTPTEAMAAMWGWEGHFDHALLFSFMQSIGVFPAGMPVRLRSNRLAVVLENKRRNSRPRVLAFYDTRERQLIEPEDITLQDSLAGDGIVAPADPAEWGLADWETVIARLTREMNLPLVA